MEEMKLENASTLAKLDSDKANVLRVYENEKAAPTSELEAERAEIQTRLTELARSGEQIGILKVALYF